MNNNKFTCITNIVVLVFAFTTLVSCFSSQKKELPASSEPESPARIYSLEDTTDLSIGDLYVVNKEYEKNDFIPNKNSAILAVSSLISEYEANNMSTAAKVKLYNVMTKDFPKQGSYKEIVIPKFRDTSEDEETIPVEENDAYMFIVPINTGFYFIQTNTHIMSTSFGGYYGYLLAPKRPYFVGKIPRTWNAVLSFTVKPQTDYIFYRGVRTNIYVPVVATKDVIRNDDRFEVVLSEKSIQTIYDEVVANVELLRPKITDETIRLHMDKVFNLSNSYYEFLLGNIPKAQQYYDESLKIELPQTGIPDSGVLQVEGLTKILKTAFEIDEALK